MDEMSTSPPSEEALRRGYQPDYFRVRPVLIAGCIFAVFVALVVLAMWLLEWSLTRQFGVVPLEEWPRRERPQSGPSIDANQPQELRALRRAEQAVLSSYGWQDEDNQVARIPIDRAIEMLTQRGLPAELPGYPTQSTDEPVPSVPGQPNAEPAAEDVREQATAPDEDSANENAAPGSDEPGEDVQP